MLPLQFLKEKTCVKAVMIISELAKYCREYYESIGSSHADRLVGFHVFKRCDVIGRFLGKSKALWWKTFKSSSQEALRALAALSEYETFPSASVLIYASVVIMPV